MKYVKSSRVLKSRFALPAQRTHGAECHAKLMYVFYGLVWWFFFRKRRIATCLSLGARHGGLDPATSSMRAHREKSELRRCGEPAALEVREKLRHSLVVLSCALRFHQSRRVAFPRKLNRKKRFIPG
jgi:hypothetical protein